MWSEEHVSSHQFRKGGPRPLHVWARNQSIWCIVRWLLAMNIKFDGQTVIKIRLVFSQSVDVFLGIVRESVEGVCEHDRGDWQELRFKASQLPEPVSNFQAQVLNSRNQSPTAFYFVFTISTLSQAFSSSLSHRKQRAF